MLDRSTHRPAARWWAVGLLAGILTGVTAGAIARSSQQAAPPAPPAIRVFHDPVVLARPGVPVILSAVAVCDPPDSPGCQITKATADVTIGTGPTRSITGSKSNGGFSFTVPAEYVTDAGFSYTLAFKTSTGGVTYPTDRTPLVVTSTAGFTPVGIAAFSWEDTAAPSATVVSLRPGRRRTEIGRTEILGDGESLGPSSFAVRSDGGVDVADWVNDRILRFDGDGRSTGAIALPEHTTYDIAATDDGGALALTLGAEPTVYTLSPTGDVVARETVPEGALRLSADAAAPALEVAPGHVEALVGNEAVEIDATSEVLSDPEFAVRWGSVGAIVTLPSGVRVGPEQFVQPLADGGVVVARGVWDDTHSGVSLIELSEDGSLRSFTLLPEPSTTQDARFSTVRWRGPDVLAAYDRGNRYEIRSFEVMS
jgi:hypothetical protein